MQIVSETVSNQNLQSARILIIAESNSKAQMLVSSLRGENCNLLGGLTSGCFTISDRLVCIVLGIIFSELMQYLNLVFLHVFYSIQAFCFLHENDLGYS